MWDIILERYNYWIVIALMMVGLYTVISRGNLVKTLIGLNLFQTSVFVLYISMGKIMGGTAPIFTEEDYDKRLKEGLADDQWTHLTFRPEGAHHEVSGHETSGHETSGRETSGQEMGAADHGGDLATGNDLHQSDMMAGNALDVSASSEVTTNSISNGIISHDAPIDMAQSSSLGLQSVADTIEVYQPLPRIVSPLADVIYSNPLPHVLILTAIVVGVATTAVGLALAVRIREAYGTIEEDELEAADAIAEFGTPSSPHETSAKGAA